MNCAKSENRYLSNLSQHRCFLFGIAILSVIFLHSPYTPKIKLLAFAREFLYIGVDIFILLSGFGIYKSLDKNDLPVYIQNRKKRLYIPYLPFILVWMAVKGTAKHLSVSSILGNLTLLGWYAGRGNQFNWYVQALLVLYILAPFIKAIVQKTTVFQNHLLIIFFFIISMNFFETELLLLFTRIPLFVLGMILSKRHSDQKPISIVPYVLSMCVGAVVLLAAFRIFPAALWDYGMYWYPMFLVVPGMCMMITLVTDKLMVAFRCVYRFISHIGESSFEIYLIHIFLRDIFVEQFEVITLSVNAGFVGLSILLGCGYRRLTQSIGFRKTRGEVNNEKKTG